MQICRVGFPIFRWLWEVWHAPPHPRSHGPGSFSFRLAHEGQFWRAFSTRVGKRFVPMFYCTNLSMERIIEASKIAAHTTFRVVKTSQHLLLSVAECQQHFIIESRQINDKRSSIEDERVKNLILLVLSLTEKRERCCKQSEILKCK